MLAFAIELARTARKITHAHYDALEENEVKAADRSLVTRIDRDIETAARREAVARGHGFIGEEFGSENPEAEYVIVMDPVDGTNHLVIHDDNFFTLIGVHHKTDGFVAGVADQPASTHLWTGLKGGGAFEHRKDDAGEIVSSRRIFSSPAATVEEAILTTFNPLIAKGPDQYFYEDIRARVKAEVPGCDSGNYARTASGRVQLVLDGGISLYDVAAHIPIFNEAGACMRRLDPDGGTREITLGTMGKFTALAAANPALLNALLEERRINFPRYLALEKAVRGVRDAHPPLKPRGG
jgi:fructose-1,6-bisphosphatase/inositol monophosphatase family enzyme